MVREATACLLPLPPLPLPPVPVPPSPPAQARPRSKYQRNHKKGTTKGVGSLCSTPSPLCPTHSLLLRTQKRSGVFVLVIHGNKTPDPFFAPVGGWKLGDVLGPLGYTPVSTGTQKGSGVFFQHPHLFALPIHFCFVISADAMGTCPCLQPAVIGQNESDAPKNGPVPARPMIGYSTVTPP